MLDLSWLASQAGVFKEGSAQDAARQQAMQQAGIKTFQQPLQWGLAGGQICCRWRCCCAVKV